MQAAVHLRRMSLIAEEGCGGDVEESDNRREYRREFSRETVHGNAIIVPALK